MDERVSRIRARYSDAMKRMSYNSVYRDPRLEDTNVDPRGYLRRRTRQERARPT